MDDDCTSVLIRRSLFAPHLSLTDRSHITVAIDSAETERPAQVCNPAWLRSMFNVSPLRTIAVVIIDNGR